jgi:hypothetical protein
MGGTVTMAGRKQSNSRLLPSACSGEGLEDGFRAV